MEHNKENLAGVFAPVVTPFDGDEPDLEALALDLARLRDTKLTGFLALGSNGEVKSLTDKERLLVLEVFAREKGDKVVMVGTGCESTAETIEKSQLAAEMGFPYVSVLPPPLLCEAHERLGVAAALRKDRRESRGACAAVQRPAVRRGRANFAEGRCRVVPTP